MNLSEYISTFLKEKNIKYVFGFQGSAMLKMLVEIEKNGIQYIQNFHEQASAFAACGYARAAGEPAVAIGTSGPGAANMIGGIADAYFDSVPVMFITGQYNSEFVFHRGGARQNGFQDMDIVNMVKPITKAAVQLDTPTNIRYELEYLWYEMMNGRQGPVLLDIPLDYQFMEVNPRELRGYQQKEKNEVNYYISRIVEQINKSQRPVILIGGGIRQAKAITEFKYIAKRLKVPVICTLQGLDCYEDIYGLAGLYGTTHGNLAAQNADFMLVLGARLGVHHIGKNIKNYTGAKICHVDIDESELGRATEEEISILADLKKFLEAFAEHLEEVDNCFEEWKDYLQKIKQELKDRVFVNNDPDPVQISKEIMRRLHSYIAVGDVGQNQVWLSQAYDSNIKNRLLNSGGYGSMGFSLPAAIGASYAISGIPVLAFTGDGGFHMNQQELLFLQLHQNNVKCIVFNNSCLGLMRETQKRYYQNKFVGNTEKDFQCVNLERLSKVYNLPYARIRSLADLDWAETIIKKDGPCLVEIVLSADSYCINSYDEMEEVGEKYKYSK